jgi:hypothetical protein
MTAYICLPDHLSLLVREIIIAARGFKIELNTNQLDNHFRCRSDNWFSEMGGYDTVYDPSNAKRHSPCAAVCLASEENQPQCSGSAWE